MNKVNPLNELGRASSAYLRSAAHQPVNWREWGDAAFEAAKRENKPVLLDIGAVWCHWCHVMDGESYENVEVAELINENFIAVKVDRDDRPDIDARYQTAVSALTGQGGWPLTAFLTAEGKPFFGGTYFPAEDSHGRPSMKRLLETIAHNFRTHCKEILASADKISEALKNVERYEKPEGGAKPEILETIVESIARMFDSHNGGFGNSPKFPHPSALDLLLEAYLESGQDWLLRMVATTLDHMGKGGVYDQIGGGFHRYSVDERWIVPHFEKMSYDNAGLLGNYLRAYRITRNDFFKEIALGILTFVEDVLSSSDGGFYASQDADINLHDDGDYFTWTLQELQAVLDETEARVAALHYHVEAAGEMHHNPAKNVLFIDQPLNAIAARTGLSEAQVEEALQRAKSKLREARARRPTPFVDTAIYTSWNGMMISALVEAYKVLGLEGARDRALLTLDLLMEKAYDPANGMAHSLVRTAGTASDSAAGASQPQYSCANFDLLDDQVFMVAALLDAFEVTGAPGYFHRAMELMDTTLRRFWDEERSGFFDTAKDAANLQGQLSLPRKAFQDSPTPAGNSIGALVLDRLAVLADNRDYYEKASTILDIFAGKAGEHGLFAATYGLALANHLRPPLEITVVGNPNDSRARELLRAANDVPRAGKRVVMLDSCSVKAENLPPGLAATLASFPLANEPVALVCVGNTCHAPVRTAKELLDAIQESAVRVEDHPS
jgi:uncharacterized protein